MNEIEFKKFLESKLWNLHIEEKEFQSNYKAAIQEFDDYIKKFSPMLKIENFNVVENVNKWTQQKGKIIFISSILQDFFGGSEIRDKVWQERKWAISPDGNQIIEIYGKN